MADATVTETTQTETMQATPQAKLTPEQIAEMAAASLVEIKANTRGKNTREVIYKGVGKFVKEKETVKEEVDGKTIEKEVEVDRLVTEDVIKNILVALALEKQDMQSLLNNWALGYNISAYKAVSDVLSEYIKPTWSTKDVAAFRLAVNNLVKLGIDMDTAVKVASSKLPS
jgi:hypothetical protein